MKTVVVDAIVSRNHNISCGLVNRHAVHTTSSLFQRPRGLPLTASGDNQSRYPAGRDNIKRGNISLPKANACDRFIRLEDCSLPSTSVMNQITPDNSDSSVPKAYSKLGKILERCESRDLVVYSANESPKIDMISSQEMVFSRC